MAMVMFIQIKFYQVNQTIFTPTV